MMVPQFMCHIKLITFLYDYSSYTSSGNKLLLWDWRCTELPYTQFHVQSNPLFLWVTSNILQTLPAILAHSCDGLDYSAHGLRSLTARSSEPLIYQGSKSLGFSDLLLLFSITKWYLSDPIHAVQPAVGDRVMMSSNTLNMVLSYSSL